MPCYCSSVRSTGDVFAHPSFTWFMSFRAVQLKVKRPALQESEGGGPEREPPLLWHPFVCCATRKQVPQSVSADCVCPIWCQAKGSTHWQGTQSAVQTFTVSSWIEWSMTRPCSWWSCDSSGTQYREVVINLKLWGKEINLTQYEQCFLKTCHSW
jgi:hypothetical protein